ncbi:hypothetical protein C7M84_012707 [Penaeus vannamei]|uniref:K Homology domain-containing protein n=1 Tax=Penaeus vannamei TaxID=6689 RepID=A0A423SY22_PENVA|nr:hypothetical protein C7M84_012707 [Penaeus vannamei]
MFPMRRKLCIIVPQVVLLTLLVLAFRVAERFTSMQDQAILELKEDIKNTPRPVLGLRQPESLDLLCPEDARKVDDKVAQIECLHAVLLEQRRLVEVERHYFAIFAGLATATLAAVAALFFLKRKFKQASPKTRVVTCLQEVEESELAEAKVESELAEAVVEESELADSLVEESELAEALVEESELAEAKVGSEVVVEESEALVEESEVAEALVEESEVAEALVEESEVAEALALVEESEVAEALVEESEVAEALVEESEVAEALVEESEVAEALVEESEVAEALVEESEVAEALVEESEVAEALVEESEVAEALVEESEVAEALVEESEVAHSVSDQQTISTSSLESRATYLQEEAAPSVSDFKVIRAPFDLQSTMCTGSMEIRHDERGLIIGKGGTRIRELSARHRVKVLYNNMDINVAITGHPADVRNFMTEVLAILERARERRVVRDSMFIAQEARPLLGHKEPAKSPKRNKRQTAKEPAKSPLIAQEPKRQTAKEPKRQTAKEPAKSPNEPKRQTAKEPKRQTAKEPAKSPNEPKRQTAKEPKRLKGRRPRNRPSRPISRGLPQRDCCEAFHPRLLLKK